MRQLSATPKMVRIEPRSAVARTWPVSASAVIRRVFEWVHRCARARCHEREPVGRNRGVKKCDCESGKHNGSEDALVHALTRCV